MHPRILLLAFRFILVVPTEGSVSVPQKDRLEGSALRSRRSVATPPLLLN